MFAEDSVKSSFDKIQIVYFYNFLVKINIFYLNKTEVENIFTYDL